MTTASGDNWLAAQKADTGNIVNVTIDTTNLAVGKYQGTIGITSNAANGPLSVPVDLEVVAQETPVISFGGVVNNGIYAAGDTLAQGTIGVLFGDQLSFQDAAGAAAVPLGTELGGSKVLVNGVEAPLYYTSYGQINFQVPFETKPGEARVSVTREGQAGNTVSVQVAARAPRVLRLGIEDYGIILNQDRTFPIPATPGIPSHPAKAGDVLVIWAIGFGQASPAVASGAGAPGSEPLARLVPTPTVFFGANLTGGAKAVPFFAGMTPSLVGLYQINVTVPANAPKTPTCRCGSRDRVTRVTPSQSPSNDSSALLRRLLSHTF